MVLDRHPRGVECREVFVDRIQPHAVWLDELFDAIVESEQIADAAGEARHNVEAAVQPKRPHVPELEPKVWEFALSSLQHATTDVDTGNLDEVGAKVAKVTPSTTGDV